MDELSLIRVLRNSKVMRDLGGGFIDNDDIRPFIDRALLMNPKTLKLRAIRINTKDLDEAVKRVAYDYLHNSTLPVYTEDLDTVNKMLIFMLAEALLYEDIDPNTKTFYTNTEDYLEIMLNIPSSTFSQDYMKLADIYGNDAIDNMIYVLSSEYLPKYVERILKYVNDINLVYLMDYSNNALDIIEIDRQLGKE